MSKVNTLAALHWHNAAIHPEQTAIVFRGASISYSEHFHRAIRLANALSAAGCQTGDRIAVLAKNCLDYLEVYTACELAGYIIVPINFRLATAEIHFVIENTEPVICFYSGEQKEILSPLILDNSSPGKYIEFDKNAGAYENFLQSGKDTTPDYTPAADDPACIVHTSGTTGRPKGAILTQGSLFGIARTISDDAGINKDDYGLVMQPLFHVGAKFLQLAHHVRGASINLQANFDTQMVWRVLNEEKVTTMQLVPTMLAMMLDHMQNDEYPETNLKTIFYSTAPIRESLLRRGLEVFGQVFLQQYGSTEAGQVSSLAKDLHITEGSAKQQQWLVSAGKANPGVELLILDEDGKRTNAGMAGEIVVRHEHIMQGYWNDKKATAETIKDGFLHMGDIGYLDEDGFLYIVDRKKDMIISGGENIYPREVEAHLMQHPAVDEVAVIGVPDDVWGEAVKAYVVCKEKVSVTENELIEFCKKGIASYKKPKSIAFVAELPRIATGKVDKVKLREPYWRGESRRVG